MKRLKLGSLFDGSGGFPLAGVINGIEPIWSSEIEPYPLKVTALRFPTVKQLGDVTKINGAAVGSVDIITFGSPCQDLSVAGKQAGIHDGERSNLFFEAIRIIKEMRNGTANEFPRWAVWENVPGAFSSNRGEDFRAVVEAFAGVVQDGLDIPLPEKWPHAGGVAGNGWSLAWRVYDAQYWGVPQRRKRIYLIADFRGERAAEILFERESMSGDFEAGGKAWEGTATDAERGAGGSGCIGIDQQGGKGTAAYGMDVSPTLCSDSHGTPHGVCYPAAFMGGQGTRARSIAYHDDGTSPTLKASPSGSNTVPDVCYPINTMVATRGGKDDMRTCFGVGESGDPQFTISAAHEHGVCYPNVARALCARADSSPCIDRGQNIICYEGQSYTLDTIDRHAIAATVGSWMSFSGGVGRTLMARDYKDAQIVCYDCRGNSDGNTSPTLTGDHQNRVTDYTACAVSEGIPPRKYIVRRLTPLECCRLQGFPDWWEDGAGGSDSARYKMWGNGIALPCAVDVLRRIAKAEEDEDHD